MAPLIECAHRQQDEDSVEHHSRQTARYQHVQEEVVGIVVEEVVEEQPEPHRCAVAQKQMIRRHERENAIPYEGAQRERNRLPQDE